MLEIEYLKEADRTLRALPRKRAGQLVRRIEPLRTEPFAPDTKALKGVPDFFRADSGEYRIVYTVAGGTLFVILIGKRNDSDVYRKLGRTSC